MIETIVGLEIHVQLSTDTKAFCGCSNSYGDEPNSNTCPICLGLPGAVPALNDKVIDYAILIGHALNCTVNKKSTIDRKKYYYPDMPKGYQLTQEETPICENGFLELDSGKKINIERIHIEEDSGRSINEKEGSTYLDYNRAGVPLVEIVTSPDISSGEEAREFLNKLRSIIRYIDISDAKMEEGSLRCDVNINIKDKQTEKKSSIVELKNLNSFSAVERGINYETTRQQDLIGKKANISTRRWDDSKNESVLMREKTGADDYKHTPDYDMPSIEISEKRIELIKNNMPELIDQKIDRFVSQYNLSQYDSEVIASSKIMADYFELIAKDITSIDLLANFIINDLLRRVEIEEFNPSELKFSTEDLVDYLKLLEEDKINNNTSRKVFRLMFEEGVKPVEYVEKNNLLQIKDDSFIDKLVQEVIDENPDVVEEYLGGRDRVLGFMVGQVMKKSKGKANPQMANEKLVEAINKDNK